jgi:hypothetical protein
MTDELPTKQDLKELQELQAQLFDVIDGLRAGTMNPAEALAHCELVAGIIKTKRSELRELQEQEQQEPKP